MKHGPYRMGGNHSKVLGRSVKAHKAGSIPAPPTSMPL